MIKLEKGKRKHMPNDLYMDAMKPCPNCGETRWAGEPHVCPSDYTELEKHILLHMRWPKFITQEEQLRFLILALCGEVGELANLVKKDWRGDEGKEERFIELKKELADVGNYYYFICKLLKINHEQIMLDKLLEVEQRPAWKERKV